MTALDRQLAKTFRAARAAISTDGWPTCAQCFDAEDLTTGYTPLRNHPNVARYYCRVCRYEFSDLTGSPLQGFDRPLSLWAFLLLGGDPKAFVLDRYSSEVQTLRKAGTNLAETRLGLAWREGLQADGVTAEALVPALKQWVRKRRARSRHGKAARTNGRAA